MIDDSYYDEISKLIIGGNQFPMISTFSIDIFTFSFNLGIYRKGFIPMPSTDQSGIQ